MVEKINNFFLKIKRKVLSKTICRNNFKTPEFYDFYFSQTEKKYIVQVGGNDGIQSDPIREYLKIRGNYKAIIFEPIQYYYKKLIQLYNDREDISIKQFFVSNNKEENKVYFIKPEIIDELDIKYPKNGWLHLHGCGSFDKKHVEDGIERNSFKGTEYSRDTSELSNHIVSESVKSFPLKDLNFPKDSLNLLIIDVQFYELEVLLSLSFNEKIDYIIYEDVFPYSLESKKIRRLLKKNNYKVIGRLSWIDQIYKKVF